MGRHSKPVVKAPRSRASTMRVLFVFSVAGALALVGTTAAAPTGALSEEPPQRVWVADPTAPRAITADGLESATVPVVERFINPVSDEVPIAPEEETTDTTEEVEETINHPEDEVDTTPEVGEDEDDDEEETPVEDVDTPDEDLPDVEQPSCD